MIEFGARVWHIGNWIEISLLSVVRNESGSLKSSGKLNYSPTRSNTLNVQETLTFLLKEDSPYTHFLYYIKHDSLQIMIWRWVYHASYCNVLMWRCVYRASYCNVLMWRCVYRASYCNVLMWRCVYRTSYCYVLMWRCVNRESYFSVWVWRFVYRASYCNVLMWRCVNRESYFNVLMWRFVYRASYCNVLMTNEMHSSYNKFLFHSFLSALRVSNESSRSS